MLGSILSKAATVGWYLSHPTLYKELGRRVRRWQVQTEATRLEAQRRRREGQQWCASQAGPMADLCAALSIPADIAPVAQAFPHEWGFALGAESQCPVAVGGPGHLDVLYHLARHLKAERAIETGVANGWSTLALLLAMRDVPGARLVSVDMPYAKLGNDRFVGCVVAPHLRAPWTLVRKPDRDAIPDALAEPGRLDLAHYDSDKTYEGRMFAYPLLWERLRPGGVLVSDDIEYDDGFREFAASVGRRAWVFEKPLAGNYCGALVKLAARPAGPARPRAAPMPAPRPLRVLFFHTNLLVGGAETLRLAQLRYLDRARVEPFVAVQNMGSWRDEPLMVRELRALDVPLFDLGARDEHPYNARALVGLARLVDRVQPHLLQTSMFVANAIGRAVALARPRLRVLTEEHNRYVWKRAHHIAVDRALAWRSQRILACSDAVAEFTARQERIDRRRFVTLHNCVDPARLRRGRDRAAVRSGLGTPPDAWVVIGVGRLSPQKGFDRLVDAVAQLPALGRPVELWVVGGNSGNERAELEARAARLSGPNAPRVRLVGLRDDVADLMAGADVFAHSARWEGFGIVLLEAMHASLPVVAFGVDGVPEVVVDGETGLLAPPDDVAALAAALASLAHDPARARALGEAGRRRLAERFTPERHLERLYRIYDDIFDEPPTSLPALARRGRAGTRPATR